MTTAEVIEEIATERRRQVEDEGWSAGHDDAHADGALAMAAALYAAGKDLRAIEVHDGGVTFVDPWPWWKVYDAGRAFSRKRACWKPKDRRRDLVRAAALIVAEIERLDRAEATGEP